MIESRTEDDKPPQNKDYQSRGKWPQKHEIGVGAVSSHQPFLLTYHFHIW